MKTEKAIENAVNTESRLKDAEWRIWDLQRTRRRMFWLFGIIVMALAYTLVPEIIDLLK